MTKLRLYIAWVLTFSVLAFGAAGQEGEKSTEEVARELLEVSGAGQMGLQVMQQMLASFKSTMPDVPQEFWDEFIRDVDPDELVKLVIPIYVKHLTKEEMEAAIAFYKTPAGQAILAKLPMIMQESMTAGQQWGMQLAAEVQRRLQEKNKKEVDPMENRSAAEQEDTTDG